MYKKSFEIANNTDYALSENLLSSRKYAVGRYRRNNGQYYEDEEHLEQMYKKFKPVTPELFYDHYYIMLRHSSIHTPLLKNLVMNAKEVGLMKVWEDQVINKLLLVFI